MKQIIYSTLLALLLGVSACKKETTPPDPCLGITCMNGGSCANGTCNCPQGYTGSDCSQQKTPVKILVTKIKITRFSNIDASGNGWDYLSDNSGPDIYPVISKAGTTIYD